MIAGHVGPGNETQLGVAANGDARTVATPVPLPRRTEAVMGNDSRMSTHFRVTRWQPGYSVDEVDTFVEAIEAVLATRSPTMSAVDVARVRFTPVQLKAGYHMDDVDAYLLDVQQRLAEHERRFGAPTKRATPLSNSEGVQHCPGCRCAELGLLHPEVPRDPGTL
jgi:DivIVA domain-containing protein